MTWPADVVPVVDLANFDPARVTRGEISEESGRICGDTLKHMIDLALARQARRHLLRAAQQGRPAQGRLEVSRRAPDVREAHRSHRLLRRDERDSRVQHLPRHVARRAARSGQHDHARAHRERDAAGRRHAARDGMQSSAHRRGGAESALRRERAVRRRGDPHHPPDGREARAARASTATGPHLVRHDLPRRRSAASSTAS